jgi:hypothetical protein
LNRFTRRFFLIVIGRSRIKQLKNFRTLAFDYGQYNTIKDSDCNNALGQPIPWYTYPTLEYLENFDLSGTKILEYGSGNSSLYYLRRGAEVTSIEDDALWHRKIKKRSVGFTNFAYFFHPEKIEYVKRHEVSDADIIIIDGSHRPDCARYVIKKVINGDSNPSLIIFDNSDWYPKTINLLDSGLNWNRVDFCGFGPINDYTWVTSIFLNPNLRIRRNSTIIRTINGIEQIGEND